jgi:hypothetical protein
MPRKRTPKKQKREEEEEGDEFFVVHKIVDEKIVKGVKYFRIKWKGYNEKHNTWEPASKFKHGFSDVLSEWRETKSKESKRTPKKKSYPRVVTPKSKRKSAVKRKLPSSTPTRKAKRQSSKKEVSSTPTRKSKRQSSKKKAASTSTPKSKRQSSKKEASEKADADWESTLDKTSDENEGGYLSSCVIC